jgi:Holliday junction resolvase RusA-like endonuclease
MKYSQTTSFTIPGEGVPKGRPRLNRKTKVYEDCVALVASASHARYTKDTELRVQVLIFTNKKSPADIDNIVKSVLDGIQKGGVIEDDSQVCDLHIQRIKSSDPKVIVSMGPAENWRTAK